ncbi:MAG: flippase [Bacteroidota bacterium]
MSKTQKSYWLTSGLFSLFEKGSVFIFGFIGTILLIRSLEIEAFGIWALFLATTSLFEVAIIGLVQNALVKYLATSDDHSYAKINSASLVLNVCFTAMAALFLFLASDWIAGMVSQLVEVDALATMFRWYTLTLFILIPFYQFNHIQQANLNFKGIFWSNFARKGLFFTFIAFLFLSGRDFVVLDLVLFQIAGASLGAVVAWYFARRYLRFSWQIESKWLQKLFSFGIFVFGTNLSTMLYKNIDRLMLGSLLTEVAVALYDLAIRITNLVDVPAVSVASVVFPQGAKKAATEGHQAIQVLYEKSVAAILCLILPFIGFILLFPEFVIVLIGGAKYLDSVPLLRLTILFGLFLPFAIQFGTVLDSIGRPFINFCFTLGGMILNVLLNYIFISNFGVVGAAYGTLLTYGITFVFNQIVLYRLFKIKAYRVLFYIPSLYREAFRIIKKALAKKEKVELEAMSSVEHE